MAGDPCLHAGGSNVDRAGPRGCVAINFGMTQTPPQDLPEADQPPRSASSRLVPLLIILAFLGAWAVIQAMTRPGALPDLPDPDAWADYRAQTLDLGPESRPVLILTTGETWCRPCRELRRRVLSDPEVDAFLAEHVDRIRIEHPARHDADRKGLADLPTEAFPTMRLMHWSSNGVQVRLREGVISGQELKEWIRWSLENADAPEIRPMILQSGL